MECNGVPVYYFFGIIIYQPFVLIWLNFSELPNFVLKADKTCQNICLTGDVASCSMCGSYSLECDDR